MCCANRNRLLEQESNSLFLYDLCQTVYLSPQICIPAGDVDACLSTESSLLRLCIFQTALKNTFFHGAIFALWRERGKDMVSLGGYCSSPLRVMHDDFSLFKTMIRQIEAICYRSATNSKFLIILRSRTKLRGYCIYRLSSLKFFNFFL